MITHLFFSGSHIWGFYNLGIIRYIQAYKKKFKLLKDIGGVSFGAIISFLFSINLNIDEIEQLFYELETINDFKCFKFSNIFNIVEYKGLDSSFKFFYIFKNYIETKYKFSDITFRELSQLFGKNLHISALCINTGIVILFNTENTPNISVYKVLEASISIPIISIPVEIDGFLYCDPGITDNTIVNFFQEIPQSQILSVIHEFKSGITIYPKGYKFSTIEYYYNLYAIYNKKRADLSALNDINKYTLVIKGHDNDIDVLLKDDCIYLSYDKNTIDMCSLYGFKLMTDWVEKHTI